MSDETLNICVCLPERHDKRPPLERAGCLAQFQQLDPAIRFRFAEYIDPPEVRALRGQPDFHKARALVKPPSKQLREALAASHIVLCVDLPFDMQDLAPRLRWVQSVGAGIAQLQNCGLDQLDCLLTSGAGITADPIAEFVLARILSHWKLFSLYGENQQKHLWKQAFGRDLAGSTLGIVGYGAIGQAIAHRAQAWGMKVLASRRHWRADATDPAVDRFFPAGELKSLLAGCDAVALCAAETPETFHLFNEDAFAAMPQGSYFCNVSRGSLVDEKALLRALQSGHLGGASIDVTTVEPLPPESALWSAPNLAISPHCAATLENFTRNGWRLFYENTKQFLAGAPLKNQRSTRYGA